MRYPAPPAAIITHIGLALKKKRAAKVPVKRAQLHQSMKLYGVIRTMAAAAIIPMVTGRMTFRTEAKYRLLLNFSKRMQIHSTSR